MIDFKSSKSLNLSIQNYGSTGTFSKLKVKSEVGILDDHMVWSPRVHTYTEIILLSKTKFDLICVFIMCK